MHDFLTDYTARLEAFRTGELVDVNMVSAAIFVQPVALTRGLMFEIKPEGRKPNWQEWGRVLEVVTTAHRELVQASGAESSAEPLIVDLELPRWPELRVMFGFVRDAASDVSLPVVTIGYRGEFEDDG